MIDAHTLVVYKNKPALVQEKPADKILITLSDGSQVKVREKDIEVIHPGPVRSLHEIDNSSDIPPDAVRETWELLLADDSAGSGVSLQELAELVCGEYSPVSAWTTYCLLLDSLYFSGTTVKIHPRQRDQVEADEQKRAEKQRASGERDLFLERLRNRRPHLSAMPADDLPDDRRFIQDVEALALGKSAKSRTMKDIGLGETPEEAHALLVECGFWTEQTNPYPDRFGVSLQAAQHIPDPPPGETRCDLTHLAAFAIDSPWSHDPDDAVSLEIDGERRVLFVHIADPAASIDMDSPAEKEARGRGATLYIPEGSFRMLAVETLPVFALGITEKSAALTFKMTLNADGAVESTEIFPSTVKVSRLTYQAADALMAHPGGGDVLRDLCTLAEQNLKRRLAAGAVNIDMPEVHMSLDQGQVIIEPIVRYRSANMVRECMLLAGEGAGIWAIQRNVPFPFIAQEMIETPAAIFPGLAGSYQLRRCMRPRVISVKPGIHEGLGLNTYTQVTSPLRRYIDLAAHIQIRRFLRGGQILSADELTGRIGAGEAATSLVTQAERASRSHWLMVYLSGKKDSVWDALALEKKGSRWAAIIPALALETQVALRKNITPNDPFRLMVKSVNIPRREAMFVAED